MKESLLIAKKLYKDIFDKPLQIYDKFVEFFGIDYVDIQDLVSFKNFCEYLNVNCKSIINCTSIGPTEKIELEPVDFTFEYYNHILNHIDCVIAKNLIVSRFSNHYYTIYVYWPEVKVTNEYDQSTIIKDLYFKTEININGKLTTHNLLLNRSTYFKKEVLKDYLHSHIPGIDSEYKFLNGCTGRGPIKNTIHYLCDNYDLDIYGLFCQELDNYVKTESILGIPYRRLSELNRKTSNDTNMYYKMLNCYDYAYPEKYENSVIWVMNNNSLFFKQFFLKFFKEFKIPFSYRNNRLQIGISINDFALHFNNYFIKYLNTCDSNFVNTLINERLLLEATINNNKLYIYNDSESNTSTLNIMLQDEANNRKLFKFKNKNVYLHIIKEEKEKKENKLYIINPGFIVFLVSLITSYINIKYHYNYGEFKKPTTEYCTSRFGENFEFF